MSKKKYEVTVGAPSLKPKKNRVWLKVLIAIILGIAIGGAGVFCYYKYYKKTKNCKPVEVVKEVEKKISENDISVDSYIVKKLINGMHYTDGSSNEKTLYIEKKTEAKDLDTDYLDNLLLKQAYRNKTNYENVVTIKELEKARIDLFGKNYDIIIPTDKKINSCPVSEYNQQERTYSQVNEKCTISSNVKIVYTTTSAVIKEKSYLKIREAVAFLSDKKLYKELDGNNNLMEEVKDVEYDSFDIRNNIDKFNQYQYNFKYDVDTSNYIFESIELVK